MKIHIKKSNVGKFNATKKATGKSTEELTHSSNPITKKRAIFAQNAKHWNHKEFGGALKKFMKDGGDVEGLQTFMQTGGKLPKLQWGTSSIPADVTAGHDNEQASVTANPNSTPLVNMDNFNTQQAQQQAVSPQYATNAPSTDVAPDNGQYSATPDTLPKPNGARQAADAFGNILGAGLATASFFEDRNKQRQMQGFNRSLGQSDSAFGAQKLNTAGNRGDYNQQGTFRPSDGVPATPTMKYPQMQQGGYANGSVHDLDENTINHLRKQGYKIEYV